LFATITTGRYFDGKNVSGGGIKVIFKKEKEVINLILKHINTVEESLATAMETVETYLKGDIPEAKSLALKVDRIETQADFIRYTIRDKLYLGAYLPMIREDIYNLIENIDRVCNAAEACCDFFLDQRPEIPEGLKPQFLRMAQESFGIIGPLKEAMLSYLEGGGKFKVIREKAKQVGIKESDVDKIEWDLTRNIFTSPLDWGHKVHLKLCLDLIVEISDRAEDAADQLELATIKSRI
jgi:predicted phosphate transport protein (TIGR00153 family)